jgi:hypothetical protein
LCPRVTRDGTKSVMATPPARRSPRGRLPAPAIRAAPSRGLPSSLRSAWTACRAGTPLAGASIACACGTWVANASSLRRPHDVAIPCALHPQAGQPAQPLCGAGGRRGDALTEHQAAHLPTVGESGPCAAKPEYMPMIDTDASHERHSGDARRPEIRVVISGRAPSDADQPSRRA